MSTTPKVKLLSQPMDVIYSAPFKGDMTRLLPKITSFPVWIFGFLCRMVLDWREREHGDVEEAVQGDLMAQQALRACGLYNF